MQGPEPQLRRGAGARQREFEPALGADHRAAGPERLGQDDAHQDPQRAAAASAGEVRIAGNAPGVETKKLISYLPDRGYFPDWMRVGDMIDLFADFYADFDRAKADEMCRVLGLDQKLAIKTLSKGTREKMQLMLVMSRAAKLYLLDEPIAGVDPAAREFIMRTILTNYSEDGSVLISTHLILDVEQVLDEAVFLRQGQVVLHESVDSIRERTGGSVDQLFRDMFRAQEWRGGQNDAC